MSKKLSLVVSVYNEEADLEAFYREAKKELEALGCDYELLFVNDGSTDASAAIIKAFAAADTKVKALLFARNFGHEAAMIAGIDYAEGERIVCMDADLQHPPAALREIMEKFEEGYEVINMVRTSNTDAGFLKNLCSSAFYSTINFVSDTKLVKNASDFFAISGKVAKILRQDYREKVRFLRAYVQHVGFRQCNLEYEAAKRVAGQSKYSIRKLFRFSMNTILCFSNVPLKLGLYASGISIFLGMAVSLYTVITWARVGTPNGYATIIVLLCFMFAMLFFVLGVIGEYMAILFLELKDRPIYIVDEKINMKDE